MLCFPYFFLSAGNGLVLCVLIKHWKQTTVTDICLFNLALSDLLFVLTLPLYAHYAATGQWTFGNFTCRIATASHKTGFFSSIFFMVVMTLDRYVVIRHALKVARYRTFRAGVALTVVVWILSFSVSLPALIVTKEINASYGQGCDYPPKNTVWVNYNLFVTNILGLLIPFLVMLICYSRIIPILMNMRSAKRHRVVRLIICIVFAFFLFWTPFHICIFLISLKDEGKLRGDACNLEKSLSLAEAITETFAYTHCCLNPVIYAFVGQKFMKRVLQLLRNWIPVLHLVNAGEPSYSSNRKSSITSRSSVVSSTFIK